MFAVLCLLLCKYLVCDLHNFNKNMAFITSNLRFQLHVTQDISMKSIMKNIDLNVNLYLEIHIFVIFIFIKTSICLHD